ncbi:MAG: 30S ribosome-binding factor RbfA [Pseudomonadota bacterium]
MGTRRVARVQDLVKEEVSRLLLFKARDEQLKSVSVTEVKMSPDLRQAVIFYTLWRQEDRDAIQRKLDKAAGFVRREVGRIISLKFAPEIRFEFDRGLEHARRMEEVLKGLSPEPESEDGNEVF